LTQSNLKKGKYIVQANANYQQSASAQHTHVTQVVDKLKLGATKPVADIAP